jgi:hypothetical protein
MSEATNETDDRTADEIEADIAETRDRLVQSVDALAAKADVKARAREKIGAAKAQAKEKTDLATEQVVATSRRLLDRLKAASPPVQVAIGAAPLALLIFIIVRRPHR